MKQTAINPLRKAWRMALLGGTAAIGLGIAADASAQQNTQSGTAPSQQPGSQLSPVVGQLRTSEQALRLSAGQIGGNQQPNFGEARTAVQSGLTVIGRVPQQMQGEDAWKTAQRQLNEAQQALQGQQPNQQQAQTQLREAADAIGALASRMAGSADAGGTAGSGQQQANAQPGQAPQVNVQQRPPQVTVQQPAPQVTVQQPAPQVTVQQPPPQVTVQQAQPQVHVQQAQPQVHVQQPGQPQVTVQREGQPQVTVQGQNGQQRAGSDQHAGTSAAPAPAQSSGAQPQQAAASNPSGVALQSVEGLVGKNVVGSNGRDAGEIKNLLIDKSGRVRAAVVEWGGFLGIGEREAVVPINRIQLGQSGSDRATLAMTRDELEALPRYDRDKVADYARQQGWGDGVRLYR